MSRILPTIALIGLLDTTLSAADWPQFLGPNRDGVSSEVVPAWTGPLKTVWKQPAGDGHSSPVVADGTVYLFFQPRGKNEDALAAYDAKTGEPKWVKSYERAAFTPPFGVGPRGTPAVAGGKVYTFGNTGILACWNAKTGDVDWKVDTLARYKAKNLFFGVSTSPTVVGNQVVVMVGGAGHGIVALDTASGKEVWAATDDPASYASPLSVERSGHTRLIFLTGNHLRALSTTGEKLWEYPFQDKLNESSTTPVKVGNIVVGGSVTAGSVGLTVNKKGDGYGVSEVWKNPKLTCYFSTPVAVGPHLYMLNGVASLTNASVTLRCVEASSGKIIWEKEKVGKYHAALVRTGDSKLLMLDDAGRLILIQPDPNGYKELARSKVCGNTWAHPALSDGRVYVRDGQDLVCVSVVP